MKMNKYACATNISRAFYISENDVSCTLAFSSLSLSLASSKQELRRRKEKKNNVGEEERRVKTTTAAAAAEGRKISIHLMNILEEKDGEEKRGTR